MSIFSLLNLKAKSSTVRGMIIVSFATLLVKVIGFAKESVISANFGMTDLLDSYYILILIPAFIRSVFIGAFKATFIPSFVNSKNKSELFGKCILLVLFLGLLLAMLGVLLSPYINKCLSDSYSQDIKDTIQSYQRYFYLCIPIWSLSSILAAMMDIRKDFLISALAPLVPSLTIIVVLIFTGLNIKFLYIGYILGAFIELLFLMVLSKFRFTIKWNDFWSQELKDLTNQFVPKLTAGLLIGMNPVVDQFFSSALGDGAISTLNYGNKFPAFIIAIISVAVTNVLLPHFSRAVGIQKEKVMADLNVKILILVVISVFFTIVLICFGESWIRLFFERDKFTESDTLTVYSVLLMYSLQIPFYVMNIALVRFLTAFNLNGFSVISSATAVILNLIGNYFLVDYLGVRGIALSTSIVIFFSACLKYFYVLHKFKG